MQRRIQETDGNWVTFQCFIQFFEVALLFRKDLSQCSFSFFYSFRADHFTECINSVAFEEHMLCTAKTDTFCTQLTCFFSICRCVCVCTNFHSSEFISPSHDSSEFASDCCRYGRDDAVIDITCGTIQGNAITFVIFFSCQCKFLVCFVHSDVAASGYTACTHTTSYYSSMRCHTTTNCQDTLCRFHTCDVFR